MNLIKIEIKYLIQFQKLFNKLKMLMMINLIIKQVFLIIVMAKLIAFEFLNLLQWTQKELIN